MNGRKGRVGDRVTIWRAARPAITTSHAAWFLDRFLASSAVLVRKWGPSWASQRLLFGREIAVWVLAVAWIGLPVAVLGHATWKLLR